MSDEAIIHTAREFALQHLLSAADDGGARYLCNKEPGTVSYVAPLLMRLFPNSRFVALFRDGRASMHHYAVGRKMI